MTFKLTEKLDYKGELHNRDNDMLCLDSSFDGCQLDTLIVEYTGVYMHDIMLMTTAYVCICNSCWPCCDFPLGWLHYMNLASFQAGRAGV